MKDAWDLIRKGVGAYFGSPETFPLRAYSEFMPPPWTALKPYAPERLLAPALPPDGFAIAEFEERRELRPGLERIAGHVIAELRNLAHGRAHGLSHSLLRGNAAWTEPLAAAAPSLGLETFPLLLPLALSRTQDDKGRVRWTLFGSSHAGPARAFWRSYGGGDPQPFLRLVGWLLGIPVPESLPDLARLGFRIVSRAADRERPELDEGELPAWTRSLRLRDGEPVESLRWVLTFEAFARLPAAVREAFLRGGLRLLPWPGSLVFWEHPGYRGMAAELPWAMQVPLLHLFPRVENRYGIRIPPSGWLDEGAAPEHTHAGGHRLTRHFVRSHRFQRVERDAEPAAHPYADKVSVALFSTAADDLDLYGKPMARNVQIWTEQYAPLLHGPSADREAIAKAARIVDQGGRFGYRFLYPPMQAGPAAIFWHRPLVARLDPHTGGVVVPDDPPLGYLEAELPDGCGVPLVPRLLDRDGYREAATAFERDPGRARFTTSVDIRRLLEWSELLGGPLDPRFARALLDVGRETSLAQWLESLPGRAEDKPAGARAAAAVRAVVGPESPALEAPSATYERSATRAFEESLWRTMAVLSEGEWRDKDNADRVLANEGRSGGKLAERVGRRAAARRDLDALGDWLHARHRELIARHGMEGRAFVADHRFRWETDFELRWSEGWAENQVGEGRERNVVVVIPGRDERSVVIMADHYDTAYMEDLYEPARGGDRLRAAAAGADDNHSATAALLATADALLPLAREGRLERTVWLVHLTGEEFPSDCLGARALVRAAVTGRLCLVRENGAEVDATDVRLAGAYVLDMIGHNHDRDRDVFQIAPGEGEGSARLARLAHEANARWNAAVRGWNQLPERHGQGRAKRMPDGREPPPPAEFLALHGEVRPEWDHRSALYNTDGQIFSDAGIPVVLFMENYDISRTGYHDTDDTMKNIDLDYAAALAAIAIESVAAAAGRKDG